MFEIEKYGMLQTVLSEKPGAFIKSYCDVLLKMSYPEDEEKIKILIPRILAWYDEGKLDELLSSKYCWSKEQHVKTHSLLNEFIKKLKINYIKPPKKVREEREFFSKGNPFDRDDDIFPPIKLG